jgi:hypothetical protein
LNSAARCESQKSWLHPATHYAVRRETSLDLTRVRQTELHSMKVKPILAQLLAGVAASAA